MIIEAREDVVKLEGSLDSNLWPTIQAAANLLLRNHPNGIIIDGSGLKDCSTGGAETFRAGMTYIQNHSARIVVCGVPNGVMQCLRTIPGIRSSLPITNTLEEARASLSLANAPGGSMSGKGAPPHDILVPLLSAEGWDSAVSLACRLAKSEGQKSHVHLEYFLEVPRTLPLTAPLPEEEAIARDVLAVAEKFVRNAGLRVTTHVARGRDAGEEIVNRTNVINANLIVLTSVPSDDPTHSTISHVADMVLDRAPCEVMLHRVTNAPPPPQVTKHGGFKILPREPRN